MCLSAPPPPTHTEPAPACVVWRLLLLPHAGQVCLFDCIEWLREQLQQWQDDAAAVALAAAAEQQLGLGLSSSRQGSSEGDWDSEEEWDPELQQLPEASTSQVCCLLSSGLHLAVPLGSGLGATPACN